MRDEPGPGVGNASATVVGELYHACYRRLVAQVYAFTADLTEAQDVVQEAFARALARPRALSDVDNPEAWLRTVAINVVRRRWRRRKVLDTILLRDRPVARMVQHAPGPERSDLRDALATLPEHQRQVVVLHYLADLPVDEVAALLDVAVGTVKSRLARARTALAEHLGDYRVERPDPDRARRTNHAEPGPGHPDHARPINHAGPRPSRAGPRPDRAEPRPSLTEPRPDHARPDTSHGHGHGHGQTNDLDHRTDMRTDPWRDTRPGNGVPTVIRDGGGACVT